MTAVVSSASQATRARLFAGLQRRNRLVGLLRLLLPLTGGLLLAVLLVQIVLDNLGDAFGFSSIRIDRDNLVVDTPHVTSTNADGTRYAVAARTARIGITDAEQVTMSDAQFSMQPLKGASLTASAPEAELAIAAQVVTVATVLDIESSDGMAGTMQDVVADMLNWQLTASGPVDISLSDGSRLKADAMHYDGRAGTWHFERVTLTLTGTPGAAEEQTP